MLFGIEQSGVSSVQVDDGPRRRIVGMVLVVYVLLIVEGALRKWALPEFGQVLFFVRDPFVLAIYGMALASGHWPRSSPLLTAALLLGLLSAVMAVVQVAVGLGNPQAPLLFAAYGMRSYFFLHSFGLRCCRDFSPRGSAACGYHHFHFRGVECVLGYRAVLFARRRSYQCGHC